MVKFVLQLKIITMRQVKHLFKRKTKTPTISIRKVGTSISYIDIVDGEPKKKIHNAFEYWIYLFGRFKFLLFIKTGSNY